MREIRAQMVFVDDPEVQDYIQSLGYSLVSSTNQVDIGFTHLLDRIIPVVR